MPGVVKRTCLKPSYNLRKQLLYSFGSSAFVSIMIIIGVGIFLARFCGQGVQQDTRERIQKMLEYDFIIGSTYIYESVGSAEVDLLNAVALISETARDRFVGYPNMEGYADDRNVPFRDMYNQSHHEYPLKSPIPLPFWWNTKNLTWNAHYFMQGSCDPDARKDSRFYHPNCTDANNNISTGGVVRPTSTNQLIYEKAGDLSWVLKATYEYHSSLYPSEKTNLRNGLYFANDGAGSTVVYDIYEKEDRDHNYTSIGCDWMREPNPFSRTNRSIGTEEQIARCHPAGSEVPPTEYNPLERAWCRDQVRRPFNSTVSRPYRGLDNEWILSYGKPVFDRLSNNFIACTLIDFSVVSYRSLFRDISMMQSTGNISIALVNWDENADVIYSADLDINAATMYKVHDLEPFMGVGMTDFNDFRTGWEDFWQQDHYRSHVTVGWTGDSNYSYLDVDDTVRSSNTYHHMVRRGEQIITLYPLPVPPRQYDPDYTPTMMLILSTDPSFLNEDIDDLDTRMDEEISNMIDEMLIAGFLGFIVVVIVIMLVSRALTMPLEWIIKATEQIIDNAGGNLGDGIDSLYNAHDRCTPNTELSTLVHDFAHMLDNFSGEGSAKAVQAEVKEIKNAFVWKDQYKSLYTIPNNIPEEKFKKSQRNKSVVPLARASVYGDKPIAYYTALLTSTAILEEQKEKSPPRVNTEPNVIVVPEKSRGGHLGMPEHRYMMSSPLFLWIYGLIAFPTLATMFIISVIVCVVVISELTEYIERVENLASGIILIRMHYSTLVAAFYFQTQLNTIMRDLYIYSRFAGWLLFGGLTRSEIFTQVISGVDECKDYYPNFEECPYFDSNLTFCDCDWRDSWVESKRSCTSMEATDSRYLQKRWYAGQSADAKPWTGARVNTSEPFATNPPETMWWNSTSNLPGAKKVRASGFKTTYDRMRVLSSMAVVEFPLYNYVKAANMKNYLGTYVGLEADGMMMGYTGCNHENYIRYSEFHPTAENRAADISPHLCPAGKYGYDPRCTEWYAEGERARVVYVGLPELHSSKAGEAMEGERVTGSRQTVQNNSNMLTMPLTYSLRDGEFYVGQTLLDVRLDEVLAQIDGDNSLESITPLLISLQQTTNLNDTIVLFPPPTRSSLFDVLSPADSHSSVFNSIHYNMTQGIDGIDNYITIAGELSHISYANVRLVTIEPVQPADFSLGVNASAFNAFSVAMVMNQSSIDHHLDLETTNYYIVLATAVLASMIIVTSLIMASLTYKTAKTLWKPIIYLTAILRNIRNGCLSDELPELKGTSLEVSKIYDLFEKLYKVVRFSDAQFYDEDLERSKEALFEAQILFRKLGNQKALGIAYNNLGTIYLRERVLGTLRDEDKFKAQSCLQEAINIGVKECNLANGHKDEIDYLKQLANRYYNNGIFQIIALNEHTRGRQDMLKAKECDEKALTKWNDEGRLKEHEVGVFEHIIARAKGVLSLIRNHELDDVFDVEDLIRQAEQIFLDNWENKGAMIFQNINRIGRSQQILDLRIQNELLKDNLAASAELAIKLLIEDEYIIDTVFTNAVAVVNKYFNESTKNVILCLDCSASMDEVKMKRAKKILLSIYEKHCEDEDFVGYVPFNNKFPIGEHFILQRKAELKSLHQLKLSFAVQAKGGSNLYAAMDYSVNMIQSISMNNTWIIALTDGDSWDEPDVVIDRIRTWNSKRSNKIHVILIGIGVQKQAFRSIKRMSRVSEHSLFINSENGLDKLDHAFKQSSHGVVGDGVTSETF